MSQADELTKVSGYVERIVYRNQENGYTVMELSTGESLLTLVGSLFYINEGEYVDAEGRLTEHPLYGEQLKVINLSVSHPKDLESIERYLASGAVKGIGPGLAGRIVLKFKEDTFRILEEEPERLSEVKGISDKMAAKIAEATVGQRERRQAVVFLQDLGIGINLAMKIYEAYKNEIYSIIKTNPYKLAEDVSGVGFKLADSIAVNSGINADSDFRIRSGLFYVLNQAVASGHTYLPKEILMRNTGYLLGITLEDIDEHLMELSMDKKITVKEEEGQTRVFLRYYYNCELEVAARLSYLNEVHKISEETLKQSLFRIENELSLTLEEKQAEAFFGAVLNGLMVITGGPGTGKTTIIRSIIRYFELEEYRVLLAAPTGRAAKRMKETCGVEAKTIHRLLGINRMDEDDSSKNFFEFNEDNPLEADVIIIDEMSMVDIGLMNSLLRAIAEGTRLILVGDVDQLPSVGAGNVLKDIIDSGNYPLVRLEKIFRQAAMSDIIVNAHKINAGEYVNPAAKSLDFLFIKGSSAESVTKSCIALVKDKLPGYVNAAREEIQILTPMRKGPLGVESLNIALQEALNPPSKNKREKEANGMIYREGDKVMQIKNNYKLEWEVRGRKGIVMETGSGIYNGDIGIIRQINTFSEELDVEFEDNHTVTYSFKQLEELELAYAVTVHKSQGSEYPAVVMPLLSGPAMLMNRNLLYTGVTRAKKCVCIVGLPDTFQSMIRNDKKVERYSGLRTRILEKEGAETEDR